jgi:hypothetical protein
MTYVILLSGRSQFGNLTRVMTRERLRKTFSLRACKTVVALIEREILIEKHLLLLAA